MERIAVVCHDAGGAEIVSSWMKQNKNNYFGTLEGPSKSIFKKKVEWVKNLSLDESIKNCDWVLCGTSWQSDLERKAIKIGRKLEKKTVAYLDHWVNYAERFEDLSLKNLPDEIWVCDYYAEKLAKEIFKKTKIVVKGNPYFDEIKLGLSKFIASKETVKKTALYICEPVRAHAKSQFGDEYFLGYTEEDALDLFLNNLNCIDKDIEQIIIRPHPSEDQSKYDWAVGHYGDIVTIGGQESLLKEIQKCDVIVGCESMAMVVGLLAEKRVINCIPKKGRPCVLPHNEIESLETLIFLRKCYD